MIDINQYRFKGLTQNAIWSTCPVIPKYHVTFGEPIERQEVSTEFEVDKHFDPRKESAIRLHGRIDFYTEHPQSGCILVSDDFGVNLMYDSTFMDMRVLEQEILKIMSYYINKVEVEAMQETDLRNVFPTIDRFNLIKEVLECEDKYQKAKLELVFCYLECYEHICDTLEQQQTIQIIVDLMAKRPRFNLSSNHFTDSYAVEIKLLENQRQLVKEFIKMQIENEKKHNDGVRESLEKTYRLLYEQNDNKWQYFGKADVQDEIEKREIAALGLGTNDDQTRIKNLENSKPGMFQAKQNAVNLNQFAEMLGLPASSLKMLLKNHIEKDPTINQSLHEHTSFIKLQEGYPIFLTETEISKKNQIIIVPGAQKIGILDMYESLSQISKVVAAGYHATKELQELHRPDNSMVSSVLDLITSEFLLSELIAVQAELRGDQIMQSRDLEVIEDSSILGSPEKMLFFIKELVASALDPELTQSPFVMTKLDITTLKEFDFDAAQGKAFKRKNILKQPTQQTQQAAVKIEEFDGKDLQVVKAFEKILQGNEDSSQSDMPDDNLEADDFAKKQQLHQHNKDKGYPRLKTKYTRPNIPSMLEVCCSTVEVLRLQQILIDAYHQRSALIAIYSQQMKAFGKEAKIWFQDPFNFDTYLSGGEDWTNFVDTGPGMNTFVKTELSVKEFDPSLTAILNFADPDAFKALVCPLGLEELRVVVRYELLNLQMLVVGVRHNQILLDNIQRQISEIELFEKGLLVSAPTIDILSQLTDSNLYDVNLKLLQSDLRRGLSKIMNEKISKISYSIIAKKLRPKENVERSFKAIRQAVLNQKYEKVEVGLRFIRTSRILLCHDYCSDIQSQIYLDSIKVELLNEVNQIRRRAYLLPKESRVHSVPPPKYGEHTSAPHNQVILDGSQTEEAVIEWQFWDSDNSKITDYFKLPDNWEMCRLITDIESFQKNNFPRKLYSYNLKASCSEDECRLINLPFIFELNQKNLISAHLPVLNYYDSASAEISMQTQGRFIDYQQAPFVNETLLYKYLFYFRQMQNFFDLEFFKNKLATRASSIATLEQSVMSGISFWELNPLDPSTRAQQERDLQRKQAEQEDSETEQNLPYSMQPNDIEFRNKLAELAVKQIAKEKEERFQLVSEIDTIKDTFTSWSRIMNNLQLNTELSECGAFLAEQVQIKFYAILLTLISVRQSQAEKGLAQKESQSINQLLKLFSHTDDQKVTYINGYHVNLATTTTSRISLENNVHRPDYNNFFAATLPVLDESQLNPAEFNLIRGLYTTNSLQWKSYRRLKPHLGWLPCRDFSYLDTGLLNVSKDFRKYIYSNIKECETDALQFSHAKLRLEPIHYKFNFNTQMEVLIEMKHFMRQQIKSNRLKTALIILMTKKLLPTDQKKLKSLFQEFNHLFSWKVSNKADQIAKQRLILAQQKIARSEINPVQKIQQEMQEKQYPRNRAIVDPLLTKYDFFGCEIDVYQREIQNFMILTAKRMIERETSSLANAFEINGKQIATLVNVHQQFAATFDDKDKLHHLDVINKVAPLQKMLTQLKNRMLQIKTLTGGEGIMIRTKDLLGILDELCRGIVKNDEIEMRTRQEILVMHIDQLQNLLYSKDQQIYSLEHKLRHAKTELNKVVNTRVFAKANSLIYELDHTMRQLRLVKDNVYTLEANLKDKIRIQFDKDLERARLELIETRKKFSEYQVTLNSHVIADVRQNINQLDNDLKAIVLQSFSAKQDQIIQIKEKAADQLVDEYAHLFRGNLKQEYKNAKSQGVSFSSPASMLASKDLEMVLREFERLKASEKEACEERLKMQNLIRKQRMMQNFKWLIAQRKWDQKIENLKQQLTSNSTLWEQLAESEKREKVLKQELQKTQQEVLTLERVVERLKDEIKNEQMEKHKLLSFKESKLKRLNQLEEMSKQMDLMSSIDMNKVIMNMGIKERQLEQLKSETKDSQEVIAKIYQNQNKELAKTREKARTESLIKEQALEKMELLRAEIHLLQSGDLSSMSLWKDKVEVLREQKSQILHKFNKESQITKPYQSRSQANQNSVTVSLTPLKSNNSVIQLNDYGVNLTPIANRKSVVKVLPDLKHRKSIGLPAMVAANNLSAKKKSVNIFDQLVLNNNQIIGNNLVVRSNSVMQQGSEPVQKRNLERKFSSNVNVPIVQFNENLKEGSSDNIFSSLMLGQKSSFATLNTIGSPDTLSGVTPQKY